MIMYNVMKAQFYQIKNDIVTYIMAFGVVLLLGFSIYLFGTDYAFSEITGSLVFSHLSDILVFYYFFAIAAVIRICGVDQADKTVNYEIMFGTKRRSIYFGRFFTALFFSIILFLAMIVLPLVFFSCKNGWGVIMPEKDGIIRTAFQIFPIIRMTCFYSALTFIIKQDMAGYIIGFVFTMTEMIINLILSEAYPDFGVFDHVIPLFSSIQLINLGNMSLSYIDGKDVMTAVDTVSQSLLTGVSCGSLITAAVFLFGGYILFSKSDVN